MVTAMRAEQITAITKQMADMTLEELSAQRESIARDYPYVAEDSTPQVQGLLLALVDTLGTLKFGDDWSAARNFE